MALHEHAIGTAWVAKLKKAAGKSEIWDGLAPDGALLNVLHLLAHLLDGDLHLDGDVRELQCG